MQIQDLQYYEKIGKQTSLNLDDLADEFADIYQNTSSKWWAIGCRHRFKLVSHTKVPDKKSLSLRILYFSSYFVT